ncbi:MAG: hypothetical protein L0Y58_23770 [Verrucomicrobia subdivision 3 bacterium]|nr:hypothetical protein [Limisphaerales bacterium]
MAYLATLLLSLLTLITDHWPNGNANFGHGPDRASHRPPDVLFPLRNALPR